MKTDQEDFIERCLHLQQRLAGIEAFNESSPRVWIAVMVGLIKELCEKEKDPDAAMDQVIKALK